MCTSLTGRNLITAASCRHLVQTSWQNPITSQGTIQADKEPIYTHPRAHNSLQTWHLLPQTGANINTLPPHLRIEHKREETQNAQSSGATHDTLIELVKEVLDDSDTVHTLTKTSVFNIYKTPRSSCKLLDIPPLTIHYATP